MFDRICSNNAVIISQQRNEPDLTREQKHEILHSLYTKTPANFIYRFGFSITDDQLKQHFDPNADYIRQLLTFNRHKIRANRRYTYMQQLLTDGTYFSDEAMKERSPLLYEQMIGKYNNNQTNSLVTRTANSPLADFYMEHLEAICYQERLEKEFENEEKLRFDDNDDQEYYDEERNYSNRERDLYRQEFIAIQKGEYSSILNYKNKNYLSICSYLSFHVIRTVNLNLVDSKHVELDSRLLRHNKCLFQCRL